MLRKAPDSALHEAVAAAVNDTLGMTGRTNPDAALEEYIHLQSPFGNDDEAASSRDRRARRMIYTMTSWAATMNTARTNAVAVMDHFGAGALTVTGFDTTIQQIGGSLPREDRDAERGDRFGVTFEIVFVLRPQDA